jgi:hypothetical protein
MNEAAWRKGMLERRKGKAWLCEEADRRERVNHRYLRPGMLGHAES